MKRKLLLILLILSIVIILSVVIILAYMVPSGWTIEIIASLVTIFSLPSGIIFYFLKQYYEYRNLKNNSSTNLYRELDDTQKALTFKSHPDDFKDILVNGEIKYRYVRRLLNHDFYDSLIFSGKINYLEPSLQQTIQNAFQRIKDHNIYIKKIRDLQDYKKSFIDFEKIMLQYYKEIDALEEILIEDIPILKEKLKEKYKIN